MLSKVGAASSLCTRCCHFKAKVLHGHRKNQITNCSRSCGVSGWADIFMSSCKRFSSFASIALVCLFSTKNLLCVKSCALIFGLLLIVRLGERERERLNISFGHSSINANRIVERKVSWPRTWLQTKVSAAVGDAASHSEGKTAVGNLLPGGRKAGASFANFALAAATFWLRSLFNFQLSLKGHKFASAPYGQAAPSTAGIFQ